MLHVVCFLFGVKRFIFSVQALEILVYMCVIFSMDKINVTKVRFLCFWCFINSTCTYACTAFIRLWNESMYVCAGLWFWKLWLQAVRSKIKDQRTNVDVIRVYIRWFGTCSALAVYLAFRCLLGVFFPSLFYGRTFCGYVTACVCAGLWCWTYRLVPVRSKITDRHTFTSHSVYQCS